MSLWGNLDASNNAPKQSSIAGYGGDTPQVTANSQVYYANTQLGAFIDRGAIGVFGVSAAEQTLSATSTGGAGHPQHAGWVIRTVGMGPIVSITANAGSVGVNSFVTFGGGLGNTGSNGTTTIAEANARIYVNTAGYILNVTLQNVGFYANTPTAVANTGNSALTITMGGRANRVQTETIVAMGSMTGDNENVY